jgi:hypothetical protein
LGIGTLGDRLKGTKAGALGAAAVAAGLGALGGPAPALAGAAHAASCAFPNSQYKHVIYIQFDNTHLRRDVPNVPSDLEQIPALKGFLTSNGSLLNNDHTILISHTAGGIISSLTGLYPNRNGVNVSNGYVQFAPNGEVAGFPSSFSYWTDPLSETDTTPNLVTTGGKNTPAPWVPYTRAGCDVGAFSTANMELENTETNSSGDITKVFGANSPQAALSNFSFNNFGSTDVDHDGDIPKDGNLATADFEGISVHCSQADSAGGGACANGQPDVLPDEPKSYEDFKGLFGALQVNPLLTGKSDTTDDGTEANLGKGNAIADVAPAVKDVFDYSFPGCKACDPGGSRPVADETGNPGFPGFSPSAAQGLGYVASMQEAGIPVTFAYLADAHDDNSPGGKLNGGNAFGPGESGYETQLREYNRAFTAFFERLAHDGIDKSNTLFVITVDEGDHFAGGTPTNPGCDGVNVPCTYGPPNQPGPHAVGEQETQLNEALKRETGDEIPFDIHFDDAPTFAVHACPPGSTVCTPDAPQPPGPNDPNVRRLERDVAKLTLSDQITGASDPVLQHIADQTDEGILHMVTEDPLRTPSFTLFGDPAFFYVTGTCENQAEPPGCPKVGSGFAWNHGDDNPEIANTWVGYVGPTIRNLGETGQTWTDHTDVQPTMLATLGLADDYQPDGRVVAPVLDPGAQPAGIQGNSSAYELLADAYKQLDAPFGQFGHDSEIVSTTAVQSVSPGDRVYQAFDAQLQACATQRDALAAQMAAALNGAGFGGQPIGTGLASRLNAHAENLIADMHRLAGMRRRTRSAADLCSSSPHGRGPAGACA